MANYGLFKALMFICFTAGIIYNSITSAPLFSFSTGTLATWAFAALGGTIIYTKIKDDGKETMDRYLGGYLCLAGIAYGLIAIIQRQLFIKHNYILQGQPAVYLGAAVLLFFTATGIILFTQKRHDSTIEKSNS